eukprot:GILJ01002238.1.p1 GENE.GILJ01002238.1~~GILJ01002238.1.p1  ORF type:complete len:173 (-),score=21.31 GILJ01002238.1:86-604(-)
MSLPKRRWEVLLDNSKSSARSTLPDPLGFRSSNSDVEESRNTTKQSQTASREIKEKKAWETATAPGKSFFMTLFMLWMSGSGVNIFSMMMTFMAMMNPVKALLNVSSAFAAFEDAHISLLLPKITYFALNCVALGAGLYKCSTLGLLPTAAGDWISLIPLKQAIEHSSGLVQ